MTHDTRPAKSPAGCGSPAREVGSASPSLLPAFARLPIIGELEMEVRCDALFEDDAAAAAAPECAITEAIVVGFKVDKEKRGGIIFRSPKDNEILTYGQEK